MEHETVYEVKSLQDPALPLGSTQSLEVKIEVGRNYAEVEISLWSNTKLYLNPQLKNSLIV